VIRLSPVLLRRLTIVARLTTVLVGTL